MNYYGVRYAKNCHPSDLFVTYFTSSKYVADYIKEHGLPDIIEIRKTFTCENRVKKAKKHEHKVLSKINAGYRDDYLNKSNMNSLDTTNLDDPAVRKRWIDNMNKARKDPEVMKRWAASMNIVRNDPKVKAKRKSSFKKKAEDRALADPRIHTFINKKTGKTETCSITSLSMMYKLCITLVGKLSEGKCKTVNGWYIVGTDLVNGNTDKTKYHFEHKDGATEYLTRKEMEKKYSINSGNMSEVMNGNRKSCKGWQVINT
jgi:hypothetical protein